MEHMRMGWRQLALMAAASFAAMYAIMYMMVDTFGNVLLNLNQLYMTLVMTAAMMLIEMTLMGSMYDKKVRALTSVASAVVGVLAFALLRGQIGITDKELLRSMIPHHGGAVLMCERADLEDPEVKELCKSIIAGQRAEIDFMKGKLSATE